jgi:hypothetical protein
MRRAGLALAGLHTPFGILDAPENYLQVDRVCGQVKCVTGNANRNAPFLIMNRAATPRQPTMSRGCRWPREETSCRPSAHRVHTVLLRLALVLRSAAAPHREPSGVLMSRSPPIARKVPTLRCALENLRKRNTAIMVAPTMGALHDVHVSLAHLALTISRREPGVALARPFACTEGPAP